MIKLIGVLVVVLGFIFGIDTLFVVVLAGIITGLVSGLSIQGILTLLGTSFVANRLVSFFILTLPVIGILERNGLRQRAVQLIEKLKVLTIGGVADIYVIIRLLAGAFSIRLGGHPQFVRPIVQPMAKAAFISKYNQEPDAKDEDKIKAISASAENYGNFFGQNLFAGSAGVLLVVSTLTTAKYPVSAISVAGASILMAIVAFVVAFFQFYAYDRRFNKKYGKDKNEKNEAELLSEGNSKEAK